jgi:hypothetical protein
MKKLVYLLWLFLPALLFFAGCKKDDGFKSENATFDDYTGTWRGTITTFKDNERRTQDGSLMIYRTGQGDHLAAILNMSYENMNHVLINHINLGVETKFNNGIWYFLLVPDDTVDVACQNWSLAGFTSLTAHGHMEINLAGNECGEIGDQFVAWSGSMIRISEELDGSACYSFGKKGNKWNYRDVLMNGDTVSCEMQITNDVTNFQCSGVSSTQSGSQVITSNFTWTADPSRYITADDAAGNRITGVFRQDALAGMPYLWTNGTDSLRMTLLKKQDTVYLSCGMFMACKFKVEAFAHSAGLESKTSMVWVLNQKGILRIESAQGKESTDIRERVLVSTNF